MKTSLESTVGRDGARDPAGYEVDGLTPAAAVAPGSYEEVAAVLRYAHAEGLAVIPWGEGSLMHIGNVPARYDIALDLRRLNAVVEYEPADMTVTCQAGTTVGKLNGRLGQSGQLVPFSLSPQDSHTVGGLLAANHSSLRPRYGGPRDFTIGMRVVTPDGRLTRAGGRVVKNVAGYDLCKAYIGSLGTLGVIVEASFKLAPLPQARQSLDLEFESLREACRFAREQQRRGLSLLVLVIRRPMAPGGEHFLPRKGFLLAIELAGTTAAVERSRRDVGELAREAAVVPLERDRPPPVEPALAETARGEETVACLASVPPGRVPALVEAFDAQVPGYAAEIAPTLGTVAATWPGASDQERLVAQAQAAAGALGGTLVVRGCSAELKRRIDVFGPPPP